VAFALVAATVLKGIFDYVGTYLVNYAGFGMITDLRDDLYNAILRSSSAFFVATPPDAAVDHCQRCREGAVRHVERAGGIPAAVLYSGFHRGGGNSGGESWRGCCCYSRRDSLLVEKKSGAGSQYNPPVGRTNWREIQNILHETITGNRIVKAFAWRTGK